MAETKIVADRINQTVEFEFSEVGLGDGTVSAPALAWQSDQNTGLYRIGLHDIAITTGGVKALEIDSNQRLIVTSTGGSGMRIYGAAGTHQWDMYLNGTDIRFSDNTGGGKVQVDTNLNVSGNVYAGDGSAAAPSIAWGSQNNTGLYKGAANAINFSSNGTGIAIIGPAGFQISTGQMLAAPGTAAAPGITFSDEPSNGFYSLGGNRIGVSIAGALVWAFTAAGDFGTNATGKLLTGDGTASSPGLQFNSQANTGIYRPALNTLGISVGGAEQWRFTNAGAVVPINSSGVIYINDGVVGTPSVAFNLDTDTGIFRNASNDLGIAAGGTLVTEFTNTKVIFSQQVLIPDGSFSVPGIALGSQQNSGIVKSGTNQLSLIQAGTQYLAWGSQGNVIVVTGPLTVSTGGIQNIDGSAAAPAYTFSNQTNTGMYRPAANAIGFVLGSSAAEWRMTATGLRPPAIDGGTTFGGFGESRALNLGTTTDITPDIDASGFIQVRTFNNVNTASSSALYYWFSSATDAQITTIVAPTGSGGPAINSVTIVAPRTIRFNIGAFSGGSAFAFFVKLHNG